MLLAAVVAASAFCLATAEAQTVAPSPQERARMEGFVDGAVREAMASRHIAGATAAVIDRDGIVMTRGYGQAGQVRLGRQRHAVSRRFDLQDADLDCDHAAGRAGKARAR
jgi:CubicO group peptidase (beta-lactamase class C family)